jgi:Fe-S-cluster containining protein
MAASPLTLEQAAPHAGGDPCATCGACCHAYYVPLSGYDVWRISRSLGLEPSDFVVAYPRPPGAPFGFRLEHGGETYELALEKQGPFELGQPCVFLDRLPGGVSRCRIYAERPAVCRAYPMKATADDVIALRPGALCPTGAWPEAEPRQPRWRAVWDDLQRQFDRYQQIVEAWNAQVALHPGRVFSMDHYLAYLVAVYDKLASSSPTP